MSIKKKLEKAMEIKPITNGFSFILGGKPGSLELTAYADVVRRQRDGSNCLYTYTSLYLILDDVCIYRATVGASEETKPKRPDLKCQALVDAFQYLRDRVKSENERKTKAAHSLFM